MPAVPLPRHLSPCSAVALARAREPRSRYPGCSLLLRAQRCSLSHPSQTLACARTPPPMLLLGPKPPAAGCPIAVPSRAGLSARPGTLGLSQQQLMRCGDEQPPQPPSSAQRDTRSLEGSAALRPTRAQPAPSHADRCTDGPLSLQPPAPPRAQPQPSTNVPGKRSCPSFPPAPRFVPP